MAISAEQAMLLIEQWYLMAIAAVEPEAAVRHHLQRDGHRLLLGGHHVVIAGRLVVIAVGKAALAMARAAASVADGLVDAGIILTKDGHARGPAPPSFIVYEAGHPIPDARGVTATRAILDLVSDLGRDDVVLALISGGGSALLEAPRPPVTLGDLARTTDMLLRAGAPIGELNGVRRPLSLVKAGGLLRAAAPARVYSAILSDVLGNDPRVIASGPTVPGRPDPDLALALLDCYGVRDQVPSSIRQALAALGTGNTSGDPSPGAVVVIGDNNTALDAARRAAEDHGCRVNVEWREAVGEAAALGRSWVERCRAAAPELDVLLGGGEATVTVRGDGIGGRNTEFALSAALALAEQGMDDWAAASLATDGEDGPTGVAGAIATATTIARAGERGVDAAAALANNDSLRVFEAGGGIVRPGPTGTNVNDLYIAVRVSPA